MLLPPSAIKATGAVNVPESFVIAGAMTIDAPKDGEDRLPSLHIEAYSGGELRLKGVPYPVVVDLAGLEAAGDRLPVLKDHEVGSTVGHTERVTIDRQGYTVTADGVVSGTGAAAKEVLATGANGFPWQASIQAVMRAPGKLTPRGRSVRVNGRTFEGPVVVASKALLREITVTGLGADIGGTSTTIAATSDSGDESMDFLKWLEAKGIDGDTLTDAVKAGLQIAYDAEVKASAGAAKDDDSTDAGTITAGGDGGSDPVNEYRQAMAAEAGRVAAITSLHREHYGGTLLEIEAKAIGEGWSSEKAELEFLRAARPKGPAIHSTESAITDGQVLQAAACQALSIDGIDEQFEAKTLEAADKEFRHSMGLQELLMICAQANGWTGRHRPIRSTARLREVLQYAFPPVIQAAGEFSGHSLASNVLSSTINKSLLPAYNAVESVWREIATIGTVSDFKTWTRYRMFGDAEFKPLSPGGEIQHGTLDAESYTINIDTFGRMYGLQRKDIINDDLGALSTLGARLGRGAALKINKDFWTAFLDNSAFFTTARGNLLEGTTYALTANDPIAAMDKAVQKFLDMKDPDDNPMAIQPAKVLFPTALRGSALDLLQSTEVRTGGGSSKTRVATRNRYANAYTPICSAYLGSAQAISGYSDTAWYLLANSMDVPLIEVAFLNGQQQPVIESAEADFNVLGILYRGYGDFGVKMHEYRGGVKVTGVAAAQ